MAYENPNFSPERFNTELASARITFGVSPLMNGQLVSRVKGELTKVASKCAAIKIVAINDSV